jgi:hypothetical protein
MTQVLNNSTTRSARLTILSLFALKRPVKAAGRRAGRIGNFTTDMAIPPEFFCDGFDGQAFGPSGHISPRFDFLRSDVQHKNAAKFRRGLRAVSKRRPRIGTRYRTSIDTRLITPIMMIIASRRRAVRTKCIDRDNYVGHQKTIPWPHACIAMNHKPGVVASTKSAIDGKFGRGASRWRNRANPERQQNCDDGQSNDHP